MLVDTTKATGTLTGKIKWQQGVSGVDLAGNRVQITEKNNPKLSIMVEADQNKRFSVELPIGEYTITSPFLLYGTDYQYQFRLRDGQAKTAKVKTNQSTDIGEFIWETTPPPPINSREKLLFSYSSNDEKSVDRFIKDYMHHYQVPGVSVVLISGGKVVYQKTFGVKNNLTLEPVAADTLFDTGSITKTLFAFAANRLAERGELDLDRPLYQILPFEGIAHDERYKLMTGRYVLSHRTGLPNWGFDNLEFEPGTKFGYSGEGIEYLKRVVMKITNKTYGDILKDEVLEPMGLNRNILFADDGTMVDVVANGHDLGRPYSLQLPEEARAAYTMHTETDVFSSFMLNLIQRKGMSAEQYKKMLTPYVRTDWDERAWPIDFGLGFQLIDSPYGLIFGHSGSNFGSLSLYDIYDEHDAGFAIFTNSESGGKLMRTFRHFLVSGGQHGGS